MKKLKRVKTKMASCSSLSSSQPRLHGACLLPGHILVNERFHGGAVVKALQGWGSYLVYGVFVVVKWLSQSSRQNSNFAAINLSGSYDL